MALAAAAQAGSAGFGLALTISTGLRPAALAVPLAGLGLCGLAYARVLARPVPGRSRLRPFAEAYAFSTFAWGLLA